MDPHISPRGSSASRLPILKIFASRARMPAMAMPLACRASTDPSASTPGQTYYRHTNTQTLRQTDTDTHIYIYVHIYICIYN
jgi:hypothetical protein